MGFIQFIFSKHFIRQMVILVGVVILSFVCLYFWMGYMTEHDTVLEVPSYLGVPTSELEAFSDTLPLQYVIIDSIYSDDYPKGTVADQDPAPGTGAKRGRKIYLTVNALMPQQMKLPDLTNLSFRQARAILQTMGFRLGDVSFRPDIAKNAVLEQQVGGKMVRPGQLLFKGARIDLVLGDGLSDVEMPMPYLLYQRLDSVLDMLRSNAFNVGLLVIDPPITDSSLVRVYRQIPAFDSTATIRGGGSFDIFLKQDTTTIDYSRALFQKAWQRFKSPVTLGAEDFEPEPTEDVE